MYFVTGRTLRCSLKEAKKKFYLSVNAIYCKIGRYASEEVVLNLLNTKCISAMLYGTEACPVMSRHKHSLDFVVTRVFMKILGTGSKQIVEDTQKYFGFLPVSTVLIFVPLVFFIISVQLKTVCAMCFTIKHEDT